MASRPSPWKVRRYATCTHVTMVRVYSYVLRCDSCGNYGPFGWLYRCSQDREEMLRDSISCGEDVTFDDLGKQLITAVQPRDRGPEKRAGNAASFLEELSQEYITDTYTSEQLLTIFKQRKHLGSVLRRESCRKTADTSQKSTDNSFEDVADQTAPSPWVPSSKDECQYKICPYCRPGGADRAYTSLDSIVNGSIPATVATGFGFHLFRQRPVCDPRLVANLGLRSTTASSTTSLETMLSSPRSASCSSTDDDDPFTATQLILARLAQDPTRLSSCTISQAHLPRSPGSPNLAAQARGPRESIDSDSSLDDSTAAFISLPSAAGGIDEDITEMEENEKEEGKFSDQPLEVHSGVAVLEESVEMHVPDILTQA